MWMLSLPGLGVFYLVNRVFRDKNSDKLDWLDAAYLMLPVISLEDRRLVEATERIKQLVRDHLPRFHPDLFAIRPLARITQWFLVLGGAILGFWIGLILADPATSGGLSRLLAAALGVLLGAVLALLGIFFSSFNRACYYTTLYHYVLSVETARLSGDTGQGTPPVILSQVLRKTTLSKKD